MKRLIATFAFLLFCSVSAHAGPIGSPAPAFSLKDLHGKTVTLAAYKGKVVLLDFWAPWCEPCKQELPELETLYRKFSKAGLVIIGISIVESNTAIEKFLKERPLSFTVLPDNDSQAAEAYGVSNLPTVCLIGRDGILRYIHKGYWEGLAPEYDKEIQELLKQ